MTTMVIADMVLCTVYIISYIRSSQSSCLHYFVHKASPTMATTDRQGEVTNRQRVHADLQILNASDSEGYSSFEDDGSDEDDVILDDL